MLPRFLKRLAARFTSSTPPPETPATGGAKIAALKKGDVLAYRSDKAWRAVWVLEVDPWPDGTSVAHCLSYQPLDQKPTVESLKHAEVLIWHSPIDADGVSRGSELIGNRQPAEDDLIGFAEYLRLTDFPRYLELMGQDGHEIVHEANAHYLRGNELCEQGRKQEGIAEYDAAVELFPLFFEAIDNRAFTRMELGDFQGALEDFEQSLQVNPDGEAAFFSKGECLMRLGQLAAAESTFKEGRERFPGKKALFDEFLERVRAQQRSGSK
ncbi:tetratricopeptide (TPR) repeat protein [Variovorax paradoxus]|uniref:tetratricopeptide repeat protein n=1 Tax=Variovorax atrisoli TaxID=3394203 RepID=UPI00119AFE07|nr:tetratricopeptide repeat protein [Variovorax paradoxus]MDR6517989.1 tetratricopeptide (TPR) repeat protein [Variovorax paradoxus]